MAEAKLGFELGDDQRLGFPVNYLSRLTEALPKAQIKDGTAALTEMRRSKVLKRWNSCARPVKYGQGLERCLPQLKPGMTRRDIADRLYISMIEEGAHPRHPGFLMLNSSTRYDDRRYNKGDRMIADFGACYEGYYGDITRMAIFGKPTDDHKKDHETACDVIQLCFESMQPVGTSIAELCGPTAASIKRAQQPSHSPKRIGHGIGMSQQSRRHGRVGHSATPGMVLALNRQVRSEKSAVHLEEDVLITEKRPEFLTSGCRDLRVIT